MKKQSGLILSVSVITVAITLVIIAYSFSSKSIPLESQKESPQTTNIGGSNQKTYIGKGYSFKYPSGQQVVEEKDTVGIYGSDSIEFQINLIDSTDIGSSSWLNKQSKIFGLPKTCFLYTKVNTIVGGSDTLLLKKDETNEKCAGPTVQTAYISKHGQYLYQIIYSNMYIGSQILSNFKFVE